MTAIPATKNHSPHRRHRAVAACRTVIAAAVALAAACARKTADAPAENSATSGAPIVVRVVTIHAEYESQERQIWDVFEQEHPGIKIRLRSVTEGPGQDAMDAATAAGNPPDDIILFQRPTKEDYRHFVNLLEIDFPWWDKYTFDARNHWSNVFGVPGVMPLAPSRATEAFSFVYNVEEFGKAGVDPKHAVRSMDDLRKLLATLKTFVDRTPGKEYVWDMAWHPWVVAEIYAAYFSYAQGGYAEDQQAVFRGDIKWTDAARNPFARYFTFLKEIYDAGYVPREWWLREWEADMETSFVGRKSMLVFHGPWIFGKVLAQDPAAVLDAFPCPAGSNGKMGGREIDLGGPAIFAKAKESPNWNAIREAFFWYTSPRVYKMLIEDVRGGEPIMDLSGLGSLKRGTPQDVKFLEPYSKGEWWGWTWDHGLFGNTSVERHRKPGAPYVLLDNSNRALLGDYLLGKISLNTVLETLQKRWEIAYPELAARQRGP